MTVPSIQCVKTDTDIYISAPASTLILQSFFYLFLHFACIRYFESKNIRAEAHLCIEYMVVYRNTDCYFTDILFGGPDKDRSEII